MSPLSLRSQPASRPCRGPATGRPRTRQELTIITVSGPSAKAAQRVRADRHTPARSHSSAPHNNTPRYTDARPVRVHPTCWMPVGDRVCSHDLLEIVGSCQRGGHMLNPSRGRPDRPDGGRRTPGEAGGVEVPPGPDFTAIDPAVGARRARDMPQTLLEYDWGFHLPRLHLPATRHGTTRARPSWPSHPRSARTSEQDQ